MKIISKESSLLDVEKFIKKELNIFSSDEKILNIKVPGEGNMNVVLRIETNKTSFILKQSRPYVNKYPDIKNSRKRIIVENEFYELITFSLILIYQKEYRKFPKDFFYLVQDKHT